MSNKYNAMTGEQLSKFPANGAIMRAAYGTAKFRTTEQAANWQRVCDYNRSQPGGMPGVGPLWNS